MTVDGSTQPATLASRHRSYFFVAAAGLMLVIVFLGFSKTFYLRPFVPAEQRFPFAAYLYVHGAVMTAWYLLFGVQAWLVASGRTRVHRRIGVVGAVLAVAVVAAGAYTSLRMPGRAAAGSFLLTLDPAFGGGGARPLGPFIESFLGTWSLHYLIPIVGLTALIARDYSAARRIHPATLLGGAVYMLYGGPLPTMLAGTQMAHDFIQRLI